MMMLHHYWLQEHLSAQETNDKRALVPKHEIIVFICNLTPYYKTYSWVFNQLFKAL